MSESNIAELEPICQSNNVAVGFVVSNYYTLPFLVALSTLFRNASASYFYDIVILETDLTELNKKRIRKLVSYPPPPSDSGNNGVKFSLRFVNISERVKQMQEKWSTKFHEQFQCLLVPDVFSRYDKVLSLNLDIVINRDVAELYRTELTDNEWIGAVIDTCATMSKRLDPDFEAEGFFKWVRDPLKYFNSGVILYNVKACRENKLMDRIVRQHSIMGLTRWKDQDLLNICCQGHVHFLNPKWNVEGPNLDRHFARLIARGDGIPSENEEYNRNREHPYILHLVGALKPWKAPQDELSPEWWKYARTLPNYEDIIYTNICELVRRETAKTLNDRENRVCELLRAEMTKSLEEHGEKVRELLRAEMTKSPEEHGEKVCELLRAEMTKSLEEHGEKVCELLRAEMAKSLEERGEKVCELLRSEMAKKLEEQRMRERQTVNRLDLLDAGQRKVNRMMSGRLSAAEHAVRNASSGARDALLLPLTWTNLQRCRLGSHLLLGKAGQHYMKKKRRLRARVRSALDFIRSK